MKTFRAWKLVARALALAGMVVLLTSCQSRFYKTCAISQGVYEGNREYSSYRTEVLFNYPWKDPSAASRPRESPGGYTRTIRREGRRYHEFQFRNVLVGRDRILLILINPDDGSFILREGKVLRALKGPALLIPFNGRSVARLWQSRELDWFRQKENPRRPALMIQLKTNRRQIIASMILREPEARDSSFRYFKAGSPPAIENLEWRERKRIILALRRSRYILTVPLDLIWLPLAWPFYTIFRSVFGSFRFAN